MVPLTKKDESPDIKELLTNMEDHMFQFPVKASIESMLDQTLKSVDKVPTTGKTSLDDLLSKVEKQIF